MALYYLSRMKIGAEYYYSPVDKKMFGSYVRIRKTATLFGKDQGSPNILGQSHQNPYDKDMLIKFKGGQMGHAIDTI